ncbi:MAG: AAA-like domain-containing protein [Chloroflexi bacterium]|nr:AAA-like domain-containing protein [Chloroflexota bacterium]
MNPIFKTRGPLDPAADGAILVKRPEFDELIRAVRAPTVDAYYAILSARQTGKTTLLYQLRAELREQGFGVALLDLAAVREQPESDFYRFVADQIQNELEPRLPRRWKKMDEAELPANSVDFRRMLFDLAKQVNAPRIAILIDEVEGVPEAFADGFFGTIRNIFSSRRKEDEAAFEKYLFVFSGAKELHRLTTGPNSPLNIAERLYLRDFELAGVRKLTKNFARAKITAPPDAAQWIFDQTHGHPYLTHKVCALLEQTRPPKVTLETVQQITADILRSDDHLERMLMQIDAEPTAKKLIQEILSQKEIRFSRLRPNIARLELLGAIRDNGVCEIRNPIYESALRTHFSFPQIESAAGETATKKWLRLLPFVAAILLGANLPVLYIYATDVLLAPRTVNAPFQFSDPAISGVIHYDRVLRSNSAEPATIIVEADQINSTQPVFVTLRKFDADLIPDGAARRALNPPAHSERFPLTLNSSGFNYNPFEPYTAHRQVEMAFESAQGGPGAVVKLDFRVDFYSAFIVSIGLAMSGAVAGLATIVRSWKRIRAFLAPPADAEKEEEE